MNPVDMNTTPEIGATSDKPWHKHDADASAGSESSGIADTAGTVVEGAADVAGGIADTAADCARRRRWLP